VVKIIQYLLQICVLIITNNYVLTLILGILLTVLINFIISLWISQIYKPVFEVTDSIDLFERQAIIKNTRAVMCHKLGGTILSSTDNIVLSKFVGLTATGLYSNYSMIIIGVNNLVNKTFGSFTASFGNAHVELKEKEKCDIYLKLNFVNLVFSGLTTVCLWILLNDFVFLWVGEMYQLDNVTVAIICVQYYMESSRIVSTSFTNGCGLFQKDVLRPFIEAVINLLISILLVSNIGIAGVFAGTIISHLITVFWREPYILFKYEFKERMNRYWMQYCKVTIISFFTACLLQIVLKAISIKLNWWIWIVKGIVSSVIYLGIISLFFYGNEEFQFCLELMINKIKKILEKNYHNI